MSFDFTAREKKLLSVLLLVIIAFLFWRVIVCRLVPELAKAHQDLRLETAYLFSAREITKQFPLLQAFAADIKGEVQSAEKIFWQEMEPASLINVLGRAGGQGLQITSLQPSGGQSDGLEENEQDEEGGTHYLQRDYEIGVRGSYDAVLEFVHKLEGELSGRISYLSLQKDEETLLVKGLIVWKIYFLPRGQKREIAHYDINFFRQDLFGPDPEPQEGYDNITDKDVEDNVMETITETGAGQDGSNDFFPEDSIAGDNEADFFYPAPYTFPFKN